MTCGLCGKQYRHIHGCALVESVLRSREQRFPRRSWQEAQLGADHWRKASVQAYGRKQALNAGAGD